MSVINENLVNSIIVSDSGGTDTLDANDNIDLYIVDGSLASLSANYTIASTNEVDDFTYVISYLGILTTALNKVTILGRELTDAQAVSKMLIVATYTAHYWQVGLYQDANSASNILLPISHLSGLTAGQIILANSSAVPTATTPTGVMAISNSGVTSIVTGTIVAGSFATGAIVNTDIANSTITPTKLSANANTIPLGIDASFETGEIGEFGFLIPVTGTVTGIFATIKKTIDAANDGVVLLKNGGGTVMTGSSLTITKGTALGSGTYFQSAITAYNTVTAGDIIKVNTSTATSGKITLALTIVKS